MAQLEDYRGERSLRQLHAAVYCVREFARDMLDQIPKQTKALRSALRLYEEVFALALGDDGIAVFAEQSVDVMAAVLKDDERLPKQFRDRRLPQVQKTLDARRGQATQQANREQQRQAEPNQTNVRKPQQ